MHSVMVRRAGWQEFEAAGHGDGDEFYCSAHVFLLRFGLGLQSLKWCHPHLVWVYQLNLSVVKPLWTHTEFCLLGDS